MRNLVRIMKSLSDETRLRIINMLFERECCVCEIIEVLGISQPRASHHLGAMYTAGLLKMRRVGLYALYSIDWESMDGYVCDLLRAVREGVRDSRAAEEDLAKLAAMRRQLPGCATAASSGRRNGYGRNVVI